LQTLADEHHQQRRKNTFPGSPQEKGSAAWFDGQYRSLEASTGSLICRAQYCSERLISPNVRGEPELSNIEQKWE
jgi:hypothetical protein